MSSTLLCQVSKCLRQSRVRCLCCDINVCLIHLREHFGRRQPKVNELVDRLNRSLELIRQFNRDHFLMEAKEKLNDWKDQSHAMIDRFYQEQCEELDRIVNEKLQRFEEEHSQIQTTVIRMIEEEATTAEEIDQTEEDIYKLEEHFKRMEHITVEFDEPPVIIDPNSIRITEKFNLKSICSRPEQTIKCPGTKSSILVTNGQCLLVHQNVHLCFFDHRGNLLRRLPWNFGKIWDACWSWKLDRFILSTENCGICFVHENTISIADNKLFRDEKFYACDCSNHCLYISTRESASKIMQFRLAPSMELIKQWKSTDICARDEMIYNLAYYDEKIALIIQRLLDKTFSIQLRLAADFQRVWSFDFNFDSRPNQIALTSFHHGHWLVISPNSSTLIHINKDGSHRDTRKYPEKAVNAVLFGQDRLAILTEDAIHIHSLSEYVQFF